jgi:hypothetical protein
MEVKEGGSSEGGQGAPSMAHTGCWCLSFQNTPEMRTWCALEGFENTFKRMNRDV